MGACFSATDDENAPHNRPRNGTSPTPAPDAANPELKGVTLETKPKRLSDEEKALRDKSLNKYKRLKAQKERREERAERHARVREAAREAGEELEELSDTCSSNMTMTTTRSSTTLAASTLVYGRGGYIGDDNEDGDDDADERRSLGSHVSGRTADSRRKTNQPRTREEKAERDRRKQRHQQYRHRHGAATNGQAGGGGAGIFNQWASASSDDAASHEDKPYHAAEHSDSDFDDDDDDRLSIASSLPRAPEDVLGVENMILPPAAHHRHHGNSEYPTELFKVPHKVPGSKARGSGQRSPCGASPSSRSPGRSPQHSPSHPAALTPPHTQTQTQPAVAAAATGGRKKWTGKQAEQNVAMSGFFATASPASASPRNHEYDDVSSPPLAAAGRAVTTVGPPAAATQKAVPSSQETSAAPTQATNLRSESAPSPSRTSMKHVDPNV